MNLFSLKNYIKLVSPLIKKINLINQEFSETYPTLEEYNKKIENLFKTIEENKIISIEQFNNYLNMRSEADAINSRNKLNSVKYNDAQIKFQRITQLFLKTNKDIEIIYHGIDKVHGRLIFGLKNKEK